MPFCIFEFYRNMKFYIETERLILRELRPSDLNGMFELDSDPEVHKHLGNKPVKTIEESRKILDNIINEGIDDSKKEVIFFKEMFHEMLSLFTQPFQNETFDFSDPKFFAQIAMLGERYSKSTELRKMNANRGSTHFIYINRTFFGLYNLMFDLKASKIKINNFNTI